MITAVDYLGDGEAAVVQKIGRSLPNPASPSSAEHGGQCTRMPRQAVVPKAEPSCLYDARMSADADLIQAAAAGTSAQLRPLCGAERIPMQSMIQLLFAAIRLLRSLQRTGRRRSSANS
jgi:hypothetical protein